MKILGLVGFGLGLFCQFGRRNWLGLGLFWVCFFGVPGGGNLRKPFWGKGLD